jgi:hypothetical protein
MLRSCAIGRLSLARRSETHQQALNLRVIHQGVNQTRPYRQPVQPRRRWHR